MSLSAEEMQELLANGTIGGEPIVKDQVCRDCGLALKPHACASCGIEDSKESFASSGECAGCGAPLCPTCGLPKVEKPFGAVVREPKELDPQEEARRHPEHYLSGYCDDDGKSRLLWDEEPGRVVIAWEDFVRLPQYSATNPTGVVAGKCWKRSVNGNGAAVRVPDPDAEWDLCWYGNRPTGFVWDKGTGEGTIDLRVMTRRIRVWGAPF